MLLYSTQYVYTLVFCMFCVSLYFCAFMKLLKHLFTLTFTVESAPRPTTKNLIDSEYYFTYKKHIQYSNNFLLQLV